MKIIDLFVLMSKKSNYLPKHIRYNDVDLYLNKNYDYFDEDDEYDIMCFVCTDNLNDEVKILDILDEPYTLEDLDL